MVIVRPDERPFRRRRCE